ncbi:MAG: hypothetical protein D3911_03915 [Candidatus Electrothrix sp. AW3_4]|nr:hypothetical protein [Candidatus Electrothrix gigas]
MIENRPLMRTIIFFFFINNLFFAEITGGYEAYAYNPYIFKIKAKKKRDYQYKNRQGFVYKGKVAL